MIRAINNWMNNVLFGRPKAGVTVVIEYMSWPLYWVVLDAETGSPIACELHTLEDAEQYCTLNGNIITKIIQ